MANFGNGLAIPGANGLAGDNAVFGGAAGEDGVAFEAVAAVVGGAADGIAAVFEDVEGASTLRAAGEELTLRDADPYGGAGLVGAGEVEGVEVAEHVGDKQQPSETCAVKRGVGEIGGHALALREYVAAVVGRCPLDPVDIPVAYGVEGQMDLGVGDAVVIDRLAGCERENRDDCQCDFTKESERFHLI